MWDLLLPVLLVSSLMLNLLLLRAVVPPDVASPVTACFVIAERLRGAVSLLRGAGLVAAGARASPRRKSPVQLPRHMVPVRLEDDDEENPVCGGSLHDDRQSAAGPRRSRQNGGDGGHRALAAAATAAVFSDSHGPDEEERGSEIASDIARPRCSSNLWGVGGTSGTPGSAEAASSVDGSEEPGDAAGDAALATRKKQVHRPPAPAGLGRDVGLYHRQGCRTALLAWPPRRRARGTRGRASRGGAGAAATTPTAEEATRATALRTAARGEAVAAPSSGAADLSQSRRSGLTTGPAPTARSSPTSRQRCRSRRSLTADARSARRRRSWRRAPPSPPGRGRGRRTRSGSASWLT
mmetsp:Transcript_10495/g.33214  ORF Transcript_10495/g.33214 Transcript_10495/m.33214 type:complete len:352 (-) Transcript_10495:124-1179(-)